ncbi:MAG: hypothetical protein GKR89_02030 [Candidatus Latescibacteria bacterium]|nr:hypothetical protein [Candidatus Latescibacterota bacterium]
MLRIITRASTPQESILAVYGKIAGPEVELLAEEGQRHLEQTTRLVLLLDGVQFIDESGLNLLRRWSELYLVLRGGTAFVRALLLAEGLQVE